MKTVFSYDLENKITICTMQIKDRIYTGTTRCHEEDYDMESVKIGEEIAYQRALVKLLKDSKKHYVMQAKTLTDFYNSLGKVGRNYTTYKLEKEISLLNETIEELKVAIVSIEKQIKEYIGNKQTFQNKVRELRKKNETAN